MEKNAPFITSCLVPPLVNSLTHRHAANAQQIPHAVAFAWYLAGVSRPKYLFKVRAQVAMVIKSSVASSIAKRTDVEQVLVLQWYHVVMDN